MSSFLRMMNKYMKCPAVASNLCTSLQCRGECACHSYTCQIVACPCCIGHQVAGGSQAACGCVCCVPSLRGPGRLWSIHGLPSIMPHGMDETPYGADFYAGCVAAQVLLSSLAELMLLPSPIKRLIRQADRLLQLIIASPRAAQPSCDKPLISMLAQSLSNWCAAALRLNSDTSHDLHCPASARCHCNFCHCPYLLRLAVAVETCSLAVAPEPAYCHCSLCHCPCLLRLAVAMEICSLAVAPEGSQAEARSGYYCAKG